MNNSLPVTSSTAEKGIKWMKENFGSKIALAVEGTPFTINHICGIFCQETLYKVALWIGKYDAETILARCIMDASGDMAGTSRSAFPKNKDAFLAKYGPDTTAMLIAEGNKGRAMPQLDAPGGYKRAEYLYKGYGIFQNDLQNILTNPAFFIEKGWYSFDHCLAGVINELKGKYAIAKNIPESIKRYNGSGERAEIYRDNVLQFSEIALIS
jgi:hypothetical protein